MTDTLPLVAEAPRVSRCDLAARAAQGWRVELNAIRVPLDASRRAGASTDLLLFVRTYFPYLRRMNRFQSAFALELQQLILSGAPIKQLKALAAPRGGGKSTICQLAVLWAALYRHVRFVLILAANGDKAKERTASIQEYVLRNELLNDDFPELCGPVRDFGGDPRRAPPGYPWSTLEGRLANGVWIVAAGIDGAIAGALRNDARPDLVLLDDVEAGTDVNSEAEGKQLDTRIQEALALPPQQGTSSVIFIGTLKSRDCLTAELTDVDLNPAWRGDRYRALEKAPAREDLWEAFMGILRPGERLGRVEQVRDAKPPEGLADTDVAAALQFPLDAFQRLKEQHRRALSFYVANATAMDEGAAVLDSDSLPLRRIYEERAVLGEKYYRCELQNDPPPPEDRLQALQLSALRGRAVAAVPPRAVPAWADAVLVTVDVGLRVMHWESSAWSFSREASTVIDCGMMSTGLGLDGRWDLAPASGRANLMERAIRETLDRLADSVREAYARVDGGEIMVPYGCVDLGGGTGQREEGDAAWAQVVIRWCGARRGRWFAMKGSGNWSDGLRKAAQDGNAAWNVERGFAVVHTDYYKTRLYDALQAPVWDDTQAAGAPQLPAVGSRSFNGEVPDAYLRQMTQEERDEKGRWVLAYRGAKNHWWDCAYMSFALADLVRRRSGPAPRRKYGRVGSAFKTAGGG
jgi:hypothetical protein